MKNFIFWMSVMGLAIAFALGMNGLHNLYLGKAEIQQPAKDPNEITIHVWTDPLTHCQYLVMPAQTNLTPRLGADGFPMCGGIPDPEVKTNAYTNL